MRKLPTLFFLVLLVTTATSVHAELPGAPGTTFRDCPDCPEMVVIPAGNFDMGSNNYGLKPVHHVKILYSFAMGKAEVTQGQWRAITGHNPSNFVDCGDYCPVERVSWDDAHDYIQKLNAKTGKHYRLPSDSEWEYACRAGLQQEYCGSDDIDSVSWYKFNSNQTTHPVAEKQPNAFGLYDMSGNVWEWVEDKAHANFNGAPANGNPWLEGGMGAMRVFRGGTWYYDHQYARSASHYGGPANFRSPLMGFRLARTLP